MSADAPGPARHSAPPDIVAAVSELLVRYATSMDTRDWQLFRSCFTADCEVDHGVRHDGVVLRFTNVEDLASWMEGAMDRHGPLVRTLTRVSNQRVEGDGDSVTVRSYIDSMRTAASGEMATNGAGFYDDTVIRVGEDWKIASRKFTSVYLRLGPGLETA